MLKEIILDLKKPIWMANNTVLSTIKRWNFQLYKTLIQTYSIPLIKDVERDSTSVGDL